MADDEKVIELRTGEVGIEEDALGPSDGAAAELQDNPACLVQGCPEPPVTHRSMKISIPVMGTGSDGQPIVVNRQEQTIQAALCERHNEMLKDPPVSVLQGKRRGNDVVLAGPGSDADRPALRIIDESSGSIN